jgi:hypothetical protein
MVERAKALSDKTLGDARSEAHRLVSEARTEAELTTQAARREVEDLTRQKDAVTSQLGQMLSGLAGIVPTVAPAAGKGESQQGGAAKPPGGETDDKVPAKANG